MDEIVKPTTTYCLQSNQISHAMYACSAVERKIIAVAIARMEKGSCEYKGERIPTYGIKMKVSEILSLLGKRHSGQTVNVIRNAVKSLTQRQVEVFVPEQETYYFFNWFIAASYNTKNNSVELSFSPIVALTILDTKQGYTRLDFLILGQLKSQYSIGFYELAKSYQGFQGKQGNSPNQWFWEMSVEDVRKKFQLHNDEYPKTENLIQKVISNPIKALNEVNPQFQIDVVKKKENRKTVGFRFVCTMLDTKKEYKISKNIPIPEKAELIQINTEESLIEQLIQQHKDEYESLLEESLKNDTMYLGNSEIQEHWAKKQAGAKLWSKYANQKKSIE